MGCTRRPQIGDTYNVHYDVGKKCNVMLKSFGDRYELCHLDILDGEHKGKIMRRDYFDVVDWLDKGYLVKPMEA